MIAATHVEMVRNVSLLCQRAGRMHDVDSNLLLALAWVHSGCDTAHADGLLPMCHETAARVARGLGVRQWDLADARTALKFGAVELQRHLERFRAPRLAVAACVAGAEAVQAAGGRVPRDAEIQRVVRDVMATWKWLIENVHELLYDGARSGPAPVSVPRDAEVLPPATHLDALNSGVETLEAPPWWLIAPPDHWTQPLAIDAATVHVVTTIAERLRLPYAHDAAHRTVYLGRPRGVTSGTRERLIVPVPGADASCNGALLDANELDIMTPLGSPVVAAGSGMIVRVLNTGATYALLLLLNRPFTCRGRAYPFAWYRGLSRLRLVDEVGGAFVGHDVEQGAILGWSGQTHHVPLLRFGVWRSDDEDFVPPYTLARYFGWMNNYF